MLQVAAFALIGLPIYVCATGATPLVAVLIAKGLSPGAALAFLLTGPATNATTFGVLEQLHGRKVALAFAGTIIDRRARCSGWVVNLVWPTAGAGIVALEQVEASRAVAIACAAAARPVVLVSLVRQGPREFLGRLWEQGGHDHDDHDHDDHDHDHDHEHHDHDHAPAKPSGCSDCH